MKTHILLILCFVVIGCKPKDPLQQATHYLIDYEYILDREALVGTMGHLVVLNPGPRVANLNVTAFFEDREPARFNLKAAPGASTESNFENWPVQPGARFALRVESSEPVVCQATVGWTNTGNNYKPDAPTRSPRGIREAAKSYMSLTTLAKHWYVADGIVINMPGQLWIRESEWALVLNPSDEPALMTMTLLDGTKPRDHGIEIPARRLRRVFMDEIAPHNRHYGVRFSGNRPVAAQWLRAVYWHDSTEVMAFWSVPCVPLVESTR
ncbi:MAG: hypothetical protein FJ395_10560 [Verrucomicrobia bacterium]|nr:hypothetical protein [Verrucomicrobiota bacterium]